MNSSDKPRGRPRAYDREQALRRARDAFWASGYQATSLDALVAATEMNRPSIYAAFGDKAALYAEIARRYAHNSVRALEHSLAGPGAVRDCLEHAFRGAARFYLEGEGGARGCFLVSTAVTEAHSDPALRKLLDATFEHFGELFAARFARAGASELQPLPARMLAELATATLLNLSLRARSGASRKRLERLIEAGIAAICAPGTKG